jgi:hypothetical protein
MEQQLGAMQHPPGAIQKTAGGLQKRVSLFEELLGAAKGRRSPSKAAAIAFDELCGAGLNRRPASEHSPGEPQRRHRRPQQALGPSMAIRQ